MNDNIEIVLNVLGEKIKSLELDNQLKAYEIDKLKAEIKALKEGKTNE